MSIEIITLDPLDADGLRTLTEVGRRAGTHGREAAWWTSAEATIEQYRTPKPGRTRLALLALRDGVPVGTAEGLQDVGEPAEVEVCVVPEARRQGIGRRLATAVADALGHGVLAQAETYDDAGVAFAQSLGLVVANREHRQLLAWPVPDDRLDALDRPVPGAAIRAWVGACPDDLLADWARLESAMNADVPLGELTRRGDVDVAGVRRNDERMAGQGYLLVRAMAFASDASSEDGWPLPVGYTYLFVSRHDPAIAAQDDTFVAREMRGRGIARALKLANLRQLAQLPEAVGVRWLQTYSSVGNEPMLALNRSVGFHVADTMTALEGPLLA